MFLGLLQILAWIATGYNIKAHNIWAASTFAFIAFFLGVCNALIITTRKINGRDTD